MGYGYAMIEVVMGFSFFFLISKNLNSLTVFMS